ncbi:MAG: hypothetical protein UV79_C0022G0002 [candidate division TM6 bacterium GW2011_GWF2_43_17]|nr:MAG: hypothetical protein UV79_C0022G0002 [candidate division TM6 bacterium GW2011_GWF2_43_17]
MTYKNIIFLFFVSLSSGLYALEGPAIQQHEQRMEKLRKRIWSEPRLRALFEEREQLRAKVNELGLRDTPEVRQMQTRIQEITNLLSMQLGPLAPWETV